MARVASLGPSHSNLAFGKLAFNRSRMCRQAATQTEETTPGARSVLADHGLSQYQFHSCEMPMRCNCRAIGTPRIAGLGPGRAGPSRPGGCFQIIAVKVAARERNLEQIPGADAVSGQVPTKPSLAPLSDASLFREVQWRRPDF